MPENQVTARFSDDGQEVTLETAEDVVCELHCNRLLALTRRTEDAMVLQPIRMLTTKPNFPLLAQRVYRDHAPTQGVHPEAAELSLFLARLFRLIYRKQWTLTGHDILGHGKWSIEDKPVVSNITEEYEGTPWQQLLQLAVRYTTLEPRIPDDAIPRARRLHDDLLVEFSPWLNDLQEPWNRPLDSEELDFARKLQDWERGNWPEEHDLDAAWRREALDMPAMELYWQRLRQRLHNLRRRKRVDGERNRRLISRLLWAGRREFLFQFHQAASMVVRALRQCPEFTPLERRAFELTHTAAWNEWTGIFRVDELMQGFIGMDVFDVPVTLWLCLLALGQDDEQFNRELVCSMWYCYLLRQREQILLQREHWTEQSGKRDGGGGVDVERIETRPETKPGDEEEADLFHPDVVEWLEERNRLAPALREVKSPMRRRALRFRIRNCDREEAASLAGCSVDTVRRAEEELDRILDEQAEG